jgi:threonine/homoserine/homoserine lactone efflux protein
VQTPLVLEGLVLGWSVAWPPGPINAEIMRRALARGFAAGFAVALGAASGDAFWAVATALGAGVLLAGAVTRLALGVISTALLLALAGIFLKGAWQGLGAWRHGAPPPPPAPRLDSPRAGFGLGLGMALTSPWNLAFWLAVMGRPQLAGRGLGAALIVGAAVLAGALAWCVIFCGAVSVLRLRVATALWDIVAKGATGILLLAFALAGALRLAGI